jgi:hypothetical protein
MRELDLTRQCKNVDFCASSKFKSSGRMLTGLTIESLT